jgi:hypothetical protein
MNNNIKIPEKTKQQIIELINNSGIQVSDFINELSNMYNIKNTNNSSQFIIDYNSYYDSFID